MRSLFGLMVTAVVVVFGSLYAWNQMRRVPLVAPAIPPKQTVENAPTATFSEAQQAQQAVKFAGPLASYMQQQQGSQAAGGESGGAGLQVENLEAAPVKPNPADHVEGSVVGSSSAIMSKTFRVRHTVQLAFQVPAHAATPHLRGNYQSFLKQTGVSYNDADAAIEFLVLNEQQYTDFLNGRAGESTFSAEDAHEQEVNTSLPPTLDQPVNYHLVFRNNVRTSQNKFVKADFRMEF